MTTPQTVSDFTRLAREAILAGNIADAEQYTAQAKALHALKSLEPTVDPSARLPFDSVPDAANASVERSAQDLAVKTWYAKQYGGDLTGDVKTVLNDLYGTEYTHLRYAKSADFMRYIRSGHFDPKLHRAVVYTPDQVLDAIAGGLSVSEIKATQVESQDQLGGYLVPPDFQDRMVERLQGLTPMRAIAETVTTMRDRVTFPVATGGDDRYTGAVRVTKVDESPVGTEAATNGTFGNIIVPVYTIMGHVAISKNVLEDTAGITSIAPYLVRQFASAYAVFEDEQFIIGNGIGGPQGILRDATTGGPYTYAYGSVATVNSGAATAIQGDSIRNLPYAIATQYRNAGAKWLMSRGSVRVTKTLKDGSGAYLWADRNQQLMNGQPSKLEGYDVAETEVLASPTTNGGAAYTANVHPILFVTQGSYLIVDRAGAMDVQRYDDSTTAKSNQIVLVARRRIGGQVLNPWGIAALKVSA